MKKLLAIGVLTLSGLSMLSAKTYDIMLSAPTKVGSVQLKPGQYKLKVEGANAIFTDTKSKSYTAPVKVQTGEKKYDDTTLQTTKDGEGDRLDEINLGGSKTKLGF